MLLGVLLVNFRDLWKSSPTSALLPRFCAHYAPPPIRIGVSSLVWCQRRGRRLPAQSPKTQNFSRHATRHPSAGRQGDRDVPTGHLGRAPDAYRMCPRPLQSLSLSRAARFDPLEAPGRLRGQIHEDPKLGRISAMRGGRACCALRMAKGMESYWGKNER